MDVVGARWWKFDFHTHTPASFDYPKGGGTSTSPSPRDWLLDYINHGIECVAVTDHNTGQWVDELKKEAEILRNEGHSIHIFPGVEITANSNIHILGIFDPEFTSSDISAVIGASKFRGEKGSSDVVAEESAENIVREIIKCGGVAIPAHIDMKAGLCQQHSSHTIKQVCDVSNAVEIIHPDKENSDAPLSKYLNLGIKLPSVIGSDSHHPDAVGRAYTWVKMSKPCIEGLKLALLDGTSSIIRSDSAKKTPNKSSNTIIHSIEIENAKYAGRAGSLKIKFNPWLNSIIGGRGSGKSSVLEFIRIGMDRSRDLNSLNSENEIRRAFSSFKKNSKSRESEGVILENTKITCIYKRDATKYKLLWDNKSDSVSISREDKGCWIHEEGDAYSRFPIKIFSQKQIFDLAKNPNTLLKLIDESLTVGFQQWKMEWNEKCSHFKTLKSQLRELELKAANKNTLLGQLYDTEQKIETLESSGHREILKDFQEYRESDLFVLSQKSHIEDLIAKIEKLIEDENLSIEKNIKNTPNINNDEDLKSKIESLKSVDLKLKLQLAASANTAKSEILDFETWYSKCSFKKNQELANQKYHQLNLSLETSGIKNPSDYTRLVEDRAQIKKSIEAIELIEKTISNIKKDVLQSYLSIVDCRKKLTENRLEFLRENIKDNPSVKIEITPLYDTEELESSFRSIIGRNDLTFSSDLFDSERQTGFLFDLNKKIYEIQNTSQIENYFKIIDNFKKSLIDFESGEIFGNKIGKRFIDFMKSLQPQIFDTLFTWFPEDKLTIKFNDGKKFKDVSQGSAGQKASAILSFLLSYGTEPLILDQPEDDLDNGLITSLIVSKLHENKENRQIIVVTHNPNIVVNGDSEYILALEGVGQISILASGGLQEKNVRQKVCEIMEGGEAALYQRYRRMFNV